MGKFQFIWEIICQDCQYVKLFVNAVNMGNYLSRLSIAGGAIGLNYSKKDFGHRLGKGFL